MQLIDWVEPKLVIAEKGKHIRAKDDVYFKNDKEEHFPYYTTTIFVPDDFTEEQMNELYVEEIIEKQDI